LSSWYNQTSFTDIADNEIHVWLNYLNVHEARIKHLYPLLSAVEKERSERFKFYKHRKAFIASHGFMHTVLGYYTPTPASEIVFSHTEKGKPFLLEEHNPDNIQFNLSHSNNIAMLAVCRNNSLGIDVEYSNKKTDWAGISKRFFAADEQQAFFKLSEDIQKQVFFQVWTRKEAHMKVTGSGLSLAPTQFSISIPPQAAAFIANHKQTDNNFYKMQDIILPEMFKGYYACLSANFNFEKISQFIHS
jgi:4'-phosphopantetheinyl transferase